ncbi:MAG: hypothetical protein WA103_04895, partial [Minisyncoccales bacterium]
MEKFKIQSVPKIIPLTLSVAIMSVMMCLTITAWDPPGETPPGDNVDAPINIGGVAQGKLGNLGIGTTSPGAKLDIADNGTAAGAQFLRVGDDTFLTDIDIAHTLGIYSQGDSTIASIKLGSNGGIISGRNNNIGIGTDSPDGTLYVARGTANGGTAVFAGTNNKSHFNYSIDEDTYIRGGKVNSKVIINDNGGNVGIGTSAPQFKLSVTGSANISRDGTSECCSSGDFTLSLAENTATTGKKAGIQFHNGNVGEGQLRLDDGNDGRELKAYSYQTDMDLHATGYVQGDKGLCIGNDCCTSWADCLGTPPDPFFLPPGGCTATLPAGNKKIFVTSTSYDDSTVHAANQTNTMANADNACQARAAAAGLTGTYKALMYETVLYGTSSCTGTTVLRNPYNVLPAAALWNGEKRADGNCDWRLIATGPSDMFDVDGDGNYLKNPIKCDEFGQSTDKQVFTNFQPTGSGTYDTANTCLAADTCHYYTRGCYYGNSANKDVNWAGAYYHWNSMGNCPAACSSTQRALYCVE